MSPRPGRIGRPARRDTAIGAATVGAATIGVVAIVVAILVAILLAISWPAAATTTMPHQGATASLDVTVAVEPAATSVVLGDSLELQITVTNDGADTTPPLVLHLDILDPDSDASVDPEDWTTTLNRPIGAIPPGGSTDIVWTVQPISAGTFSAYAVVVRPTGAGLSASDVTEVTVEDQRSLNPGNILPLAIGAPLLVGGALAVQLLSVRRSDRRGRDTATDSATGALA